MLSSLFLELAAVIITAGLLSLIAARLRQPLIIAYLLTGVVVGPNLLGLAQSTTVFETMSSIGVAFLLFIVGLGLNWRNVRDVGLVSVMSGLSQMVITSSVGFLVARTLDYDYWTSAFLGVGFAFSSTIIIVKMLTDKEDLDRLYGRIAVGALIVQDLLAMILLLLITAYGEGGSFTQMISTTAIKGGGALLALWLLSRYLVPPLFRFASKSGELLFLTAIAWCFAVAGGLQILGFGIEIGALLAGVSLAGTIFATEIEAKVRIMRDFFLVIFFIVLGTHLPVQTLGDYLIPGLAFSAFVLIGNPIIMMIVMRILGHHPRTGFLAGVTVGQISEFSFILFATGITVGLISSATLPLATFVALITITGSSYLIAYNERLFEFFSRLFPKLSEGEKEKNRFNLGAPEIILFGFDSMGGEILPSIQKITNNYLIVDINPTVVEKLKDQAIPVIYGDAGEEDTLRAIKSAASKLIISTIPDMEVNRDLLDFIKLNHSKAVVVLTAKNSDKAARCYELGANFVIVPSILGGLHFAKILEKTPIAKRAWQQIAKKIRA